MPFFHGEVVRFFPATVLIVSHVFAVRVRNSRFYVSKPLREREAAGAYRAPYLSDVEGDAGCAAEGGHVVGGNNVAAFDAERKHGLRRDH